MNVAEHPFHFVTASYLTPQLVAVLEWATIRLESARCQLCGLGMVNELVASDGKTGQEATCQRLIRPTLPGGADDTLQVSALSERVSSIGHMNRENHAWSFPYTSWTPSL